MVPSLDYGWYLHVRIFVMLVGVYGLALAADHRSLFWSLWFGGMAVLFNPIFPFHMDRDYWRMVDLVAILGILGAWWRFRHAR